MILGRDEHHLYFHILRTQRAETHLQTALYLVAHAIGALVVLGIIHADTFDIVPTGKDILASLEQNPDIFVVVGA